MFELGIASFGDMGLTDDKSSVGAIRAANLLDEIRAVDRLGLDVFALGEHHRPDYLSSAPTVILGAAATVTNRIKLSTAVTVLSSEDPVRVYQQFATLDLISRGRAEIMAGRGSFIESFPLFGYDLADYDALFIEKLDLLLKINRSEKLTWTGQFRPALTDVGIYPRAYQRQLPIWIAAGGTPASAVRAATLGLPITLAIIGGRPDQFLPFIDLYKNTWYQNKQPGEPRIAINCHTYVAQDGKKAVSKFYPPYAEIMSRVGKERGWGPMTISQFEGLRSPKGSLVVGSVQEVIDKIMYLHSLFSNTRFLAQMSIGSLPHEDLMSSLELFGTEVAPIIRKNIQ
jgi:probable LLM family oxidoreductase